MTKLISSFARIVVVIGITVFGWAYTPAIAQSGGAERAVSGLPMAEPGEVGMSADALDKIRPAMQSYVDDGRLAGVVTMIARRGRVIQWDAVGFRDLESRDPLERDDIFRIYSMTKPITTIAVMMLVEEGRISLDEPVSKYIPQFDDVQVLTESGERVPIKHPITVKHLLIHTSGLTYGFFGDTAVDQLYQEANVFTQSRGLDDFAERVARLPLLAQPGEVWNYSVSTDILGRVVEIVSDKSFDTFVAERITEPLGMSDTAFWVAPDHRSRFMANYQIVDGSLQVTDSPVDGEYTEQPMWLSGGGGLVSTASDYIRLAQMFLQDGELDGVRLLRAETVREMRRNHLADTITPINVGDYLSPGYGFGLGFAVLVDEDASPEPDTEGVFRWAGAANTFFWIDPKEELIGMVWTQISPFFVYPIEKEFQTLVYGAIVD